LESEFLTFNTARLINTGKSIEPPSQTEVKSSTQMVNASLDDALKYGGDLTRLAISQMNLRFDRKYVVVDTKVHMLMPGMSPAIPGWHTDGAPRDEKFSPIGSGPPNMFLQNQLISPRYHLMVTDGGNSFTEFLKQSLTIRVPLHPKPSLYNHLTRYVDSLYEDTPNKDYIDIAWPNQIYEFDWWNLHRGVPAKEKGWRYLIRVTESDYLEPWTDLRDILRTQIQVYVPETFGW